MGVTVAACLPGLKNGSVGWLLWICWGEGWWLLLGHIGRFVTKVQVGNHVSDSLKMCRIFENSRIYTCKAISKIFWAHWDWRMAILDLLIQIRLPSKGNELVHVGLVHYLSLLSIDYLRLISLIFAYWLTSYATSLWEERG